MSYDWFNLSAPVWHLAGRRVRLWNLFNRNATDYHWWGVGLLQINGRHLLYLSSGGFYAFFIGEAP